MKKILNKKMLLCCSVVMLALFGLYGCASKKGNDSGNANVGDTNAGDTNAGGANVGGTNVGDTNVGDVPAGEANVENTDATDGQAGNPNDKLEKDVQREYTIGDVSGLKRFELDHEVGNITLGASDDDKIHIKANSYVTAYSQENLDKIVDNIDIISNVVDDTCILNVVHKNEGTEFWDWLEKEVKQYNVTIDLEILLPKNFDSYDVSVDTGEIYLAGLKGSMDLETDTGVIEVVLNENLSNSSAIELETDNGNIVVNLNKNKIQYTQNESNHMKAIVNNVCILEASVENGAINVIQ